MIIFLVGFGIGIDVCVMCICAGIESREDRCDYGEIFC